MDSINEKMHTELRKVVSAKMNIHIDGTLRTGFFTSGLEYSNAEHITRRLRSWVARSAFGTPWFSKRCAIRTNMNDFLKACVSD